MKHPTISSSPSQQKGLVLIVALIMLVIISLFTITSIRSAISSESIANNTRMVELATQAADIALRHCEKSAVRALKDLAGFGDTTVTNACNGNENYPYQGFDSAQGTIPVEVRQCVKPLVTGGALRNATVTVATPRQIIWGGDGMQWSKKLSDGTTLIWDSNTTMTFVLPLTMVGTATFKRPPECMVESLATSLPVVTATNATKGIPTGGDAQRFTASFVVTARGFGPDVPAADANRSRPVGTEVWLQSTIEYD